MQQRLVRISPVHRLLRQPVNFRRGETEAQHIVKIKIMQLIRSDQRLRLLRDLAVLLRREKLRAYGRVENVQQHRTQRAALCDIRLIAHDVPHQCLRDTRVDAVHTHMVAVIGRPAQRQLAQIARADHQTAGPVCKVHQLQRPHPRLSVLIRHILYIFALPDVREVAADGVCDLNFPEADAELVAEDLRVRARAVCRAEARHGDCQNVGHRAAQPLHRAHRHQQRQAAVEPSGNADHGGLRVRVLDAL